MKAALHDALLHQISIDMNMLQHMVKLSITEQEY